MKEQNHQMRRRDRALTAEDSWRLLETEHVGRLGLTAQSGYPYVVPLHHIVIDRQIFFHSALSGKKLDLILENPKVCYEVDRFLGLKEGPEACDYGSFYESVILFGEAFLVTDMSQKVAILNALTRHLAGSDKEFGPVTAERAEKVAVVGIRVVELSGKSRLIGR